tara:strand:+ start:11734 stop:14502 length:2769 start_codon:yes stop_codon:yes gene_type:complete
MLHFVACKRASAETIDRNADRTGNQAVDFRTEIFPILQRNCIACHRENESEGDLVLETPAAMLRGGDSGPALMIDDAAESLILTRARSTDDSMMPPDDNSVGAKQLTEKQLRLLERWIRQGASDTRVHNDHATAWQPIPDTIRAINALDVSPNGKWVCFGLANQVVVWDAVMQREVTRLIDPSITSNAAAAHDLVQSIACSPDGQRIAAGGFQAVRLWKKTHQPAASTTVDDILSRAIGPIAVDHARTNIAIVNAIGEVEIWNTNDRAKRCSLLVSADPIKQMQWASEVEILCVVDEIGRMFIIDAQHGKIIAQLDTRTIIDHFSIASDGATIITIVDGHAEHFQFTAKAKSKAATIRRVRKHSTKATDVSSAIALAGNPKMAILGTRGGKVMLVDLTKNKVTRTLTHGSAITSLAVLAENTKADNSKNESTQLLTGGIDGDAKLWSLNDGKLVATYPTHTQSNDITEKELHDVKRQQDHVARLNAKTKLLEDRVKTEEETVANKAKELSEQTKKLKQIDSDSDDAKEKTQEAESAIDKLKKTLAAARKARQLAASAIPPHNRELSLASRRLQAFQRAADLRELSISQSEIIAFDSEESRGLIAILHRDGSAQIIHRETGQSIASLRFGSSGDRLDDQASSGLCFLADRLVRYRQDHPAESLLRTPRWQLERVLTTAKTMATSEQPNTETDRIQGRVTSLTFHPDGKLLAIGCGTPSRAGDVKVFAVETGRRIREFDAIHSDTVFSMSFSDDGDTLATASADNNICLLDVAEGTAVKTLEGHTGHVLSLAWNADSQTIVSASADLTVRLWDSESGETTSKVTGFAKEITAVDFVPTASQAIAASGDGRVRLFDSTTGKTIRSFTAKPSAPLTEFLFTAKLSPDGKRLYAGGRTGTLWGWTVADGKRFAQWPESQSMPISTAP